MWDLNDTDYRPVETVQPGPNRAFRPSSPTDRRLPEFAFFLVQRGVFGVYSISVHPLSPSLSVTSPALQAGDDTKFAHPRRMSPPVSSHCESRWAPAHPCSTVCRTMEAIVDLNKGLCVCVCAMFGLYILGVSTQVDL